MSMTVEDLRCAISDMPGEWQIMVQVEQNGPVSGMAAAANVYADNGGSRPLVVLDLVGHSPPTSVHRTKI